MQKYNIVTLPGDGIGPDITQCAVEALEKTAEIFGFEISVEQALIGGIAIDKTGNPLPKETLEVCKKSDAVLLGAVGGPKWDVGTIRPEQGLLGIRAGLGLFANLRPAIVYNALKSASPLKDEIISGGLDILVVRELTGGIYFGKRERLQSQELGEYAYDTEMYSKKEIIRIAKLGFESAQKRSKRLCSVDKANILDSSKLWRETVIELSKDYPDVELTHMYVDNAAMQLVRNPSQFDVIVTSNMFGDILSDEASQITGSIGMLPSASIGSTKIGLYEPIHGSAPDIAGKNIANPLATILSLAMMLRYSLGNIQAADAVEKAVEKTLNNGYRTADIAQKGEKVLGTKEITQKVIEALSK